MTTIKDCQLMLGDCLERMKEIPDGSVDLVVTSPPYDNLRDYKGYSFDFEQIANQIMRVLKKGGVLVWVVGDATVKGSETGSSFRQALYFKDTCRLNLHDTMIWQKAKMPQNHNRYEQFFEYMFIFSKGKPATFNGIRDKKNIEAGTTAHVSYRDKDGLVKKTRAFNKTKIAEYGLRYNIWAITPCLSKENRVGHPAPFPIQLAKDHILSWTNENEVVLDPFMGSGTTGAAAIEMKRRFIGIEISEEYFQMSQNRLQTTMEVSNGKATR